MFTFLIRMYRLLISPLLPQNTCRFYPSCSAYALEAFTKYNVFKAAYITLKRLFKCHPLHSGGYDPVP